MSEPQRAKRNSRFQPGTSGNPAGRPPPRLAAELADQLGEPPVGNVLEYASWISRGLGLLSWWVATGRVSQALSQSLRASLQAAHRSIPVHVLARAEQALREDDASVARASDGGPEPQPKGADAVPARRSPPRGF